MVAMSWRPRERAPVSDHSGEQTYASEPLAAAPPAWHDPLAINRSSRSLDRPIALVEPIAFPHSDTISAALGQGVCGDAVVDPAGCERRGVEAFTDGATTHFASPAPPLHVAAHEAAHLLQHRGATCDADLGAEGHAGAVADAVVAGSWARGLIGSAGSPVAGGLHDYTVIHPQDQTIDSFAGSNQSLKVSDDGKMAVGSDEGFQNKLLYADLLVAYEANAALQEQGSGFQMEPTGDTLLGKPPADPDGDPQVLQRIEPQLLMGAGWTSDDAEEGARETWADCGKTAREIMGPMWLDADPVGVTRDESGALRETATRDKAPQALLDEILLNANLGGAERDVTLARDNYALMTDDEKEAFDKKHGLDRHARPGVGEAYSITPSPLDERRAENTSGANFHWGGVIMASGPDRVTLENFIGAGETYDAANDDWSIEMYGSAKKGQTFDETWSEQFGESATTIHARMPTAGES